MKKGFTLLEMLAIIVLLLIISSIAILDFNKRTDKADQDAALANARTYIAEVNRYFLKQDLNEEVPLEAGTYSVNEPNGEMDSLNDILKFSGTNPTSGNVTISEDYQVTQALLQFKYYGVSYQNGKYELIKE